MANQDTANRQKVLAHFDHSQLTVYRKSELTELQDEHGRDWNVSARMTSEARRVESSGAGSDGSVRRQGDVRFRRFDLQSLQREISDLRLGGLPSA